MIQLDFYKMHGLGNDFILIDGILTPLYLNKLHIQFLCNRKLGIGADQLLLIESATNNQADFNYRIFNQDGEEIEQCGNGARCVIKYLFNHYPVLPNIIKLQTKNRIITGFQDTNGHITINMGIPQFLPTNVSFIAPFNPYNSYTLNLNNQQINFGIVSMGNPHAIIQIAKLEDLKNLAQLEQIACLLQQSKLFTQGVNVNFFWLQDKHTLHLCTYERGCGFTLACGSGACATAAFSIAKNMVNKKVTIILPLGSLSITWDNTTEKSELLMTGEASVVFQGKIKLCS